MIKSTISDLLKTFKAVFQSYWTFCASDFSLERSLFDILTFDDSMIWLCNKLILPSIDTSKTDMMYSRNGILIKSLLFLE